MTSILLPDHLTPLPCLLSPMNQLLHPTPSHTYTPAAQHIPPRPPPHVFPHPSLCSFSALKICLQSRPHHSLCLPSLPSLSALKICLQCFHPISALTPAAYHAWAPALEP
ncbi:hypothetical protein O181_069799 [Austropuccinia psidii MF-1]|uniref:Uncharacterized protein n=1 Tax=Austropuccinia psidii MF-1 TaxID=1389203 RepID=A0A9Q3EZJ5_9BASI|nr:hypothetical protein [Austropuccinia psidii MF-1]